MTKCHGFVPEGAEMGWAVAGALIAVTPPRCLLSLRADPPCAPTLQEGF